MCGSANFTAHTHKHLKPALCMLQCMNTAPVVHGCLVLIHDCVAARKGGGGGHNEHNDPRLEGEGSVLHKLESQAVVLAKRRVETNNQSVPMGQHACSNKLCRQVLCYHALFEAE